MTTPLPRSLAPLADESLPGYLLRLAHRLDLSPARLAQITGLAQPPHGARVSFMLTLPPDGAAAFAHTVRLTTTEIAALTLDSLNTHYPPLQPVRAKRRRLAHGLFVKENWVYSRFTRYCPDCLAGDGSVIQQRHGGAWTKLWRLPIVFACIRHDRMLEYTCPACRSPALARGKGLAMLPRGSDSTLHPTACRATIRPSDSGSSSACGHRLDDAAVGASTANPDALRLQDKLLTLLRPATLANDTTVTSVGQPATPAQYFIDLRILACLISASWPTAAQLITNQHHAAAIDEHVHHLRAQIVDTERHNGRKARAHAYYDKPPTDAATSAALLAEANTITTASTPDVVRDVLAALLDVEPASRAWARQFLTGDGYCSPGLQTALGPEVGALHVIKRIGLPRQSSYRRLPPPRPVAFAVQHIPQRPPRQWIDDYFHDFTCLRQRVLEHVIVTRLARTSLGGALPDAAVHLGIPRYAAVNAFKVIDHTLSRTRLTAFDAAIDRLVQHLDSSTELVDYGKRRHALRDWEITPSQWLALIAGLPGRPVMGRIAPQTHWGDGKRRLASVWIWTQLTHGDHIYAPAVRPDPQAPRPGGDEVRYVHTRWRFIERPPGHGHYEDLRERLDPFAQQLAQQIKSNVRAGT